MEVSKVQLANGEVLVDLTNDSVTPDKLAEGTTAHDASGEKITGTMKAGGGSVQSDWNQTDESAADFIKNRTHYEGYNSVKFDGEVMLDDTGYAEFLPIGLVEGQLYSVLYEGEVYETTAIDLAVLELPGYMAIGNLDNFEIPGGSHFPFQIVDVSGFGCMLYDCADARNISVRLAVVEGNEIGDTVILDNPEMLAYFAKVSDRLPTEADLANGYRVKVISAGEERILDTSNSTLEHEAGVLYIVDNATGVQAVIIASLHDNDFGLPVGLYFVDTSNFPAIPTRFTTESFTIYNSTIFAKRIEDKRLDAKFLPENIVLTSPGGKRFIITVDDSGAMTTTEVVE